MAKKNKIRLREPGPLRVAGYFRVSTERQEKADLSIPDQRRQVLEYCKSREMILVSEYIEHGLTATDDKRPELQRLFERATDEDYPYDCIAVHSYSRFFRDSYQSEFYIRRLAMAGVRVISITQEVSDDLGGEMVRKFIAIFDEYQSQEISKHVLRGMKENARQGFNNGSHPPLGYCLQEVERRGTKIKRRLAIDPVEAELVMLIFRLFDQGDGIEGPLGIKKIAAWLNEKGYRTRQGGYFGKGGIHHILTNPCYKGEMIFNRRQGKTGAEKPPSEHIVVRVPPIVDTADFDRTQETLRVKRPQNTPPRVVNGPILLTGLAVCAQCGGAMTLRTGTSRNGSVFRYYSCSQAMKKGKAVCEGKSVNMDVLDSAVTEHLCERLLTPERIVELIESVAERRSKKAAELDGRIKALRADLNEAEGRLRRLYDSIERGIIDEDDLLRDRIDQLKTHRRQAQEALARVSSAHVTKAAVTEEMIVEFASAMRENITQGSVTLRKAYIRAIVQSVEVGRGLVRIIGMKSLLEAAVQDKKNWINPVRSFEPKWWARRDSNPQPSGYEPLNLSIAYDYSRCLRIPILRFKALIILQYAPQLCTFGILGTRISSTKTGAPTVPERLITGILMSDQAKVLTDAFIRSLKPSEKGKRYAVADAVVPGLKIRVTDRGTKSFIVWKRWGGAQNPSARALGTFGPSDGGKQLTLAGARSKAREWLEMRAVGKDPKQVALQESLVEAAKKANTFESVMDAYLARHVRGHRKADQTEREIRKELLPALRDRPIADVTRKDLISIIDRIVDRGANYQAHNVWGHASSLFNWAIDGDYGLEVSPCWPKKPRSLLTKEGAKKPRQRVLKEAEIGALWQASGELGYPYGPLFQLLLLTGQRKNEIAGASWSEFDLINRTLTIPSERFKSDAAHVVSLSDEVMQIMTSLPRWTEGEHIFSTTNGRVPVNGFSKAKRRLDAGMEVRLEGKPSPFVIHDIRRTVRTGLAQAKVPEHVAELVIGHARRGLAGVYDRHSYLEERRAALCEWACRVMRVLNLVSTKTGNV